MVILGCGAFICWITRVFAEAGYVVLTFGYNGWGDSKGAQEPLGTL